MKLTLVVVLVLSMSRISGQHELTAYLSSHQYSFYLDKGFDKATCDTLKRKLSNYRLIIQAEGGSHFLDIYSKLPLVWVNFLQAGFGLQHFFLECSHATAICADKFLQTGDTNFLFRPNSTSYWQQYRDINATLDPPKKVELFGVDFNSTSTYLKALRILIPVATPPADISDEIELIGDSANRLPDCDALLDFNANLKKHFTAHPASYRAFLGNNFFDFERIVMSKGTCKDKFKNRNNNIANNFLSFDTAHHDRIYYGELGMAHTISKNDVAASIINRSDAFKDKVCVVNLYCANCTTSKESVSNWPLKGIEKDIQTYFLPLCSAKFTLFDLSVPSLVVKKYQQYGQFLIIVDGEK